MTTKAATTRAPIIRFGGRGKLRLITAGGWSSMETNHVKRPLGDESCSGLPLTEHARSARILRCEEIDCKMPQYFIWMSPYEKKSSYFKPGGMFCGSGSLLCCAKSVDGQMEVEREQIQAFRRRAKESHSYLLLCW